MLGINTKRFEFFPQIAATTFGLTLSIGNILSTLNLIDLSGWFLLFLVCLLPASIFCYHLIFKFELTTQQLVFINCMSIITFSIITFQFDFTPYSTGEPIIEPNWVLQRKFFIFSLVSLLASLLCAYVHAARVLENTPYLKAKTIELWHLQLFPESNTHDFWLTLRKPWKLLVVLILTGGTMLYLAVTNMDETHPRFITFVTTHSVIFMLILILHTLTGITLGELLAAIRCQNRLGILPSIYCNMDERVKWRHDYVKYHLPAPIRKLNLRLFNQHIEAYERLQNE